MCVCVGGVNCVNTLSLEAYLKKKCIVQRNVQLCFMFFVKEANGLKNK